MSSYFYTVSASVPAAVPAPAPALPTTPVASQTQAVSSTSRLITWLGNHKALVALGSVVGYACNSSEPLKLLAAHSLETSLCWGKGVGMALLTAMFYPTCLDCLSSVPAAAPTPSPTAGWYSLPTATLPFLPSASLPQPTGQRIASSKGKQQRNANKHAARRTIPTPPISPVPSAAEEQHALGLRESRDWSSYLNSNDLDRKGNRKRVISGIIVSSAAVATYSNLILRVWYTDRRGTATDSADAPLPLTIEPGGSVDLVKTKLKIVPVGSTITRLKLVGVTSLLPTE